MSEQAKNVTLDDIKPGMIPEKRTAVLAAIREAAGGNPKPEPLKMPDGQPVPDQETADTVASNLLKRPAPELTKEERRFLRDYVAAHWR